MRKGTGSRARAGLDAGLSAAALCAAVILAGCGDDGGAAAQGAGGGGGGGGGAGGGGGGGGGGGTACLDASVHEALFSVLDPALCAVAVYTAGVDLGYTAAPTWGRHGGPLLVFPASNGAAEVQQLFLPAGTTGALTATSTTIDAGIPAGAFVGAQAIDLPFFNWTAISWAGAFPDTQGELILLDGAAIALRYPINGLFAAAGVSAPAGGRLLHTGLSAVADSATMVNALYAADTCGTAGQDARLLPETDPACAAPIEVAAWGDFSGPIAMDRDGNAFVAMPFFDGTQEIRAFSAATIAPGAGATAGTSLLTLPGGGVGLAVLAPSAGIPGLLAFQPTDPTTYEALDPIEIAYTADGGVVQADTDPIPLLSLVTPGTLLSFMTDADERLWVSAPTPGGGTTFVVLARAVGAASSP